jgi:hypothetical protein
MAEETPGPEWVSEEEAARRLGMSEALFAEALILTTRIEPGTLRDDPQPTNYEKQDGEELFD